MAIFIFILSYLLYIFVSITYFHPYLIILWLITSYIMAFLTVIIFYLLNFPIVLILSPTHPYKAYLMKSLSSFLNKCVMNLKVNIEGLDNIPKQGSIVAYANHKSYTDAFAIIQYFPRAITLAPKKSIFKVPFLKWWLKAYDVFPISRDVAKDTRQELEKAIRTVQNNHVILYFPEGTIKHRFNTNVENAKAGAFRLVKDAQADLLPIRFEGNDLVRDRWPKRTKRKIIIYPVISYDSFKDLSTKDIARVFMDKINNKI